MSRLVECRPMIRYPVVSFSLKRKRQQRLVADKIFSSQSLVFRFDKLERNSPSKSSE